MFAVMLNMTINITTMILTTSYETPSVTNTIGPPIPGPPVEGMIML